MRSKYPTQRKPTTLMYYKNTYTIPRTKVDNWYSIMSAEKKDNDVFRNKLSYHISTYNRFGTEDQEFISETQHMTSQVLKNAWPKALNLPLVNFTSYPVTEIPDRVLKVTHTPRLPPDCGVTDYTTTQQYSFKNPYCHKVLKPLTLPSQPWMMSRVIRSELIQNFGTAPPPGNNTWLDQHTPLPPIRALKLQRYKSFNPATGLQDFPAVDDMLGSLNTYKNI